MIWFLIWLAFTFFIVWLFARSMRTVWKQQRNWAIFGRKHGLLYLKPVWYKAPSLEGDIKGRRIRLYVEEVVDPVVRIREFRTTLEIYFKKGFPTGIGIGSRAYQDTLRSIENVEPLALPTEIEFSGLLSVARETDIAMAYLAPRQDALKEFFGTKRCERLLMAHETDGFLVLQTGDSLDDVKALNTMVKKLFTIAEKLEPDDDVFLAETPSELIEPELPLAPEPAETDNITIETEEENK